MLKFYQADLHIHTCLSPCGDSKMSPKKIIEKVLNNSVDIIAICDHNTVENIPAVIKVAEGKNVTVLPGMEICTKEEIHVLALFGNIETAFEMQAKVYDQLQGKNDPEVFGMQIIGNEFDEVLGFNERLLIGATDMTIEKTVDRIHKLNGIAIASHIDRESFSVVGQLGFIPETLKFDALEISSNLTIPEARKRFGEYGNYQLIQNSDAHFIDDVGKCTTVYLLEKPTFDEIKKALKNEDSRKIMNHFIIGSMDQ